MSGVAPVSPKYQFKDNLGVPLVGGTLDIYLAGTTTRSNSWQDKAQSSLNTNPIVLDSRGECVIWLATDLAYKFVLKDANGVSQWTVDNINGASSAGFLYFLQAGTGATTRTIESKLRDTVSVKDFGAVGDGVTDDRAAFQAAHDALSSAGNSIGGEIIVPASTSGYYLGGTWNIRKRVTIRGTARGDQSSTSAGRLIFPQDTTGIRLYSTIDSGTGEGADFSRIIGLNLSAQAKNSSGNGIESTTEVILEECVVRSFKGHGVYIHGQTGVGATGIADLSRLTGVRCVNNGGDGFHIQGNDSNVITLINCSSASNTGYGYYDNASYCNTYIACHEAGSTSGSYYNRNGTGLGGVYLGCYTEAGNPTDFDTNVLVLGGVMNFGTSTSGNYIRPNAGLEINVPTGGVIVFKRNNVEVGRIQTDNTLINFAGALFGTGVAGTNFIDMRAANVIDVSGSSTSAQDRMRFDNPNGRVGSISTSGSATAYNTSSDYRLKDNPQSMQGALARIALLKPVTFKWKVDGSDGEGFIAHELQEVCPHAVTGEKDAASVEEVKDADGNVVVDAEGLALTKTTPVYQGVDSSFLVALLTAGLQELKAEFDAYKAAHP